MLTGLLLLSLAVAALVLALTDFKP